MMRILARICLLGVMSIGLALTGCDDNGDTKTDAGVDVPATPEACLATFPSDWKTSGYFTNMAVPVEGASPHGTVQIWYSDDLEDLIAQDTFTAPEGAVSIKTVEMADGSTGIVTMVKKGADYDPDNGNWCYEVRDDTGETLVDGGKIGMCINCHVGWKDKDYLGGTDLTSSPAPCFETFPADYQTTGYFTNMAAPVMGASPHGTVQIWYSDDLKDLIGTDGFTAPEGAASIKTVEMSDGSKGVVTMVKKGAEYDPDNGNWCYEVRDETAATVTDAGRIGMCINCHVGWKDTKDYLGGTDLQ